ncbi:cation:proton antiporter [Corynebacterium ammoniagenes]|uniref:Na+/H+ antiporter n=1 Tax=Corynebacterium ammoniagenes DSM 20306 TaxID=649754 RepID=A0ABN0AH28_CORAM|nr:sodium:proton antiporter [Corynebacterium ammoniagenes]APT81625.1 sodium:proton antiporter [Corynebacterium ammoniagenes DSM 20306]AQS72745.1 sodium:proton antiporter [Corynebacterium ammoniagenes]EFG82147.1 putative Na+/H+ antiporter [Corynebacterium ammoniagenes DSM 20306]
MDVLMILTGLLAATVGAVALGNKTGLPWPALLTLLTTAVVFIPGFTTFTVPSELILPIFLPPLLWALARRTSWGVIREQWRTILLLSVVLVVLTTAGVGVAAYFWLPGIGLAGAILIGAAIAPPDPVAVEAVAEPAGIPHRITTSLQTEGLFNDAASIVLFHLALFAITEGDDLSVAGGVLNFVYSSVVAAILGLVVGWVAAWFMKHIDDSTARNALTWVIPFGTYITAEFLEASGVIAVVIAAIELSSRAPLFAEDRSSGRNFWETAELLFTGVAFGLIGMSVRNAIDEVGADLWHSVFVGVGLSIVAIVIRGVWMYIVCLINQKTGQRRSAPTRLQEVLLMTWSGMRGLVTLALILSIPTGALAYHHELAVVALTVLLITMVIPGLLLPWLMNQLSLQTQSEAAEDAMRAVISERSRQAAMRSLRGYADTLDPDIAAAIDNWFEETLGAGDLSAENRSVRMEKIKRARKEASKAREVALLASQQELIHMRNNREYNPVLVDEILGEVDRALLTVKDRQ